MRLSDFEVLTFDCYGTLIDWETGIYAALNPWLQQHGLTLSADTVLETFARYESAQQAETPTMRYAELLAVVHKRLEHHWSLPSSAAEAEAFGHSIAHWPAFSDSAAALQYLKQHYKLVILSNVDRHSFTASQRQLRVAFDAIYTAEDIGSYKPNQRNFTYMLEHLATQRIAPARILHTAQSLFHDHIPATALGLATCWIDRRHAQSGHGATPPPASHVCVDFRFESLAALVDAHQREMAQ